MNNSYYLFEASLVILIMLNNIQIKRYLLKNIINNVLILQEYRNGIKTTVQINN